MAGLGKYLGLATHRMDIKFWGVGKGRGKFKPHKPTNLDSFVSVVRCGRAVDGGGLCGRCWVLLGIPLAQGTRAGGAGQPWRDAVLVEFCSCATPRVGSADNTRGVS